MVARCPVSGGPGNPFAVSASIILWAGVLMAWFLLTIAGLLEIVWAVGLKYTQGFTRLWPSIGTILAMIASMVLLAWALRTIPVGTGYAVWTGIGAVGAAILGMVLFGESREPMRLACIGLIVLGIVGLKVASPH
jgi:quaternary ammonium compound-resistance protein SugE